MPLTVRFLATSASAAASIISCVILFPKAFHERHPSCGVRDKLFQPAGKSFERLIGDVWRSGGGGGGWRWVEAVAKATRVAIIYGKQIRVHVLHDHYTYPIPV